MIILSILSFLLMACAYFVYHPARTRGRAVPRTRLCDDARTRGAGAARVSQSTLRPIKAARPQVARKGARSLACASAVCA